MRVFLSHSSNEEKLASDVCSCIEANGHSCFLAPRDIRSGYEYAEEIINGIDNCDIMLLLLSESANNSPHVLREVERAVSKKKSIIVYKLEDIVLSKSLEYFLMTHQWLNAKPNKGYGEIIRCINDFAENHSENADGSPDHTNEQGTLQTNKKPSDKGKLLWIIIAVAVIAAAVTGIVIAVNTSHGGTSESSVISSESESTDETPVIADLPDNSSADASDSDSTVSDEYNHDSENTDPTVNDNSQTSSAETDNSATASQGNTPVNTPETSKPQNTQSSQSDTEPEASVQVELGDSMYLGTYNNEPIKWRVIHIADDGKSAVVIADDILTMKAYDAAEGGKYNKVNGVDYWTTPTSEISPDIQRLARGDNRWELSNIRTWLNSSKENVVYNDQAPVAKAMSEYKNGYNTEPGFLNGFTKDELSVITAANIKTGNSTTSDRVFLLSSDEIQWLYDADVSIYAEPTQAAVEQDSAGWYKTNKSVYGTDDHFWWLRDADSSDSCKVHLVNISYITDERINSKNAGLEGYGIRPAMTIDLTAEKLSSIMETTNEIN